MPPAPVAHLARTAVMALVLSSAVGCGVSRGVARYYGLSADRLPPAEHMAALGLPAVLPARGGAPKGVVLMLPGCMGTRAFHHEWASFVRERGWSAMIVESFEPRGITEAERHRDVCRGRALWGADRAGDVLATLDHLRERPEPWTDRVVLLGWSHGGWAVMDAVAHAHGGRRPPNLSHLPSEPLSVVRAVGAVYPYCGFGASAARDPWPEDLPTLLLVSERDDVVDPEVCRRLADRLAGSETVAYDADHWFDNPRDEEWIAHRFDAEAAADARRRIAELLTRAEQAP